MIGMIQNSRIHNTMAAQLQSQYGIKNDTSVERKQFKGLFAEQIKEANNLEHIANVETQKFITGETDNIHDLMIAMEESKIALEMTTQVRNKVVDAYQELKNMQI